MYKFLLLLFFFFPMGVMAQWHVETALDWRCSRDLNLSDEQCELLSSKTIEILDYHLSKNKMTFFKTELLFWLEDKEVQSYLKILPLKFKTSGFHFFSFTREFFKSHEKLKNNYGEYYAEQLIAILFQDNLRRLHINWLKTLPYIYQAELLEKVLLAFNKALEHLQIYPDSVSMYFKKHTNQPYFFYLPLKLALDSRHLINVKNISFHFYPFYLSLLHKLHYSNGKYWKTLLWRPESLEQSEAWDYRLNSLYYSYVAIHYVKQTLPLDLNHFKQEMYLDLDHFLLSL